MAYKSKLFGYDVKDEAARNDLSEIGAYIGYPDDNVLGLEADFENSTFNRLGAAKGLNAGSDFNAFKMYGERKLCNLADDGTITAWYGDPNYTETGYTTIVDPDTQEETTIQVQVMVRQPKFYYKVVPIKLEPITSTDPTQTGVHGYSGVKMNYYISDKPLPGFKLHPAFINANGDEVDCYYIGAYEATVYDVSENEYRLYDSWDVTYDPNTDTYDVIASSTYKPTTSDKLSSIAGAKPMTGQSTTAFTRYGVKTIARNRGTGWDSLNIKIVSAEQLLIVIEYGGFNMQTSIGRGIVDYAAGGSSYNQAAFSGSTYSIGNGSGVAASTRRLQQNGTLNIYTTEGYTAERYRGVEDLWGNVHNFVDGINIYGDDTMESGEAYICDDFNFANNKNDGNYKPVGFTIPYVNGDSYIKYFGYNDTYDWLFILTKLGGNSSIPVGDSAYTTSTLNGYKTCLIGGRWSNGSVSGAFCFVMNYDTSASYRFFGARLCYV